MKRMMLYFGSFNPVHCGHISLAEYVVEQGLCDELVLVVSPQSPFKEYGELAPEMERFEMAETACTASRYPEKIKASAVEFLLPRPSYTIDTLRYLRENFGSEMELSLLMGADQIAGLDGWKDYRELLSEYPIYVYPRRNQQTQRFAERITLLEGAPLVDISATRIRECIQRGEDTAQMLPAGVAEYIRRKGLWSPAARIATLTAQIDALQNGQTTVEAGEVYTAEKKDNNACTSTDMPGLARMYVERGMLRYRFNEWGAALNDFNRALQIDPDHAEARQYVEMVQEILAFRYTDIYNP